MSAADSQKIAMRGAGYYSANTVGAKNVIDKVGDLVVKTVAKMPRLADGQTFAIADFGAADGGTSMDMMRRLVGAIRATEPSDNIDHLHGPAPQRFLDPFQAEPGACRARHGRSAGRDPRAIRFRQRHQLLSPDPARQFPVIRLLRHGYALDQQAPLHDRRPCPGGWRD